MKSLKRALIVGGSSDDLNTNSILRQFVAEGMREAFPEALVVECGPDAAFRQARDLSPDLLLVFGSVMLDDVDHLPAIETARRSGARIAFWLHDDPYEFDSAYRALPLADVIFTNEVSCLDFYPPSIEVYHLPLAASPGRHYRKIAPRSGSDLFFCGHMYQNRRSVLEEINNLNARRDYRILFCGSSDVVIGSKYWSALRLNNDALAEFNAASLSVLNVGREYDLANARFNVRPATPGPRTFEAAMAGAAQIIYGTGHEIAHYFEPGRECLVASSTDELFDQLDRLIHQPSISLSIGAAAQNRASRDHSYSSRMSALVSLV